MLAETKTSRPLRMNGWASAARMRSATIAASAGAAMLSSRIVNSSPPSRAHESGRSTRHQVGEPHGRDQPLGQFGEELVARFVPQAVVDELEVVEVEKQHGERRFVRPRAAAEAMLNAVEEQQAIRQAGERVGDFALGDVGDRARDAGRLSLGCFARPGPRQRNHRYSPSRWSMRNSISYVPRSVSQASRSL